MDIDLQPALMALAMILSVHLKIFIERLLSARHCARSLTEMVFPAESVCWGGVLQ